MNLLDVIAVIVVLIGFTLGFKDGCVRKLIGLIGFALAIFLAAKYALLVGQKINDYFGIEYYLSKILAGIVIFFTVVVIFAVLKRIVHPFDKVNNLLNRILGGLLGSIQILFFLSGVLFILNLFNSPPENVRKDSLFYAKIYNIIPFTINYINDYTPKTKEFIKDYINQKDSV